MSKKLFSSLRWKAYLKRRQKNQLRNHRRKNKRPRFLAVFKEKQQRLQRQEQTIVAPKVLSFIHNPEMALRFFASIEWYATKYPVHLDLSQVETITCDAVAALVASLRDINVSGNLPNNEAAQQMFIGSGFMEHVRKLKVLPQIDKGSILRQASKKVEPEFARRLVRFGTKAIYGEPQKVGQRTAH